MTMDDESRNAVSRLPEDWWQYAEACSALSKWFIRHLLVLFVKYESQAGTFYKTWTGFLLELGEHLLWISAGHVINDVDKLLSSRNVDVKMMRWVECPAEMDLDFIEELKRGETSVDQAAARFAVMLVEMLESQTEKGVTMSGFTASAHALLVGVGDYAHPRFANLPVTVQDVQAIAAVLTDPARCGYPSDRVKVITGEQATAAAVRAGLESLAQSTDSQSIVFIYFSGHGGRALESGDWRAYLCPREADPDDLTNTAIPGDEFSVLLTAIPAQKMMVMIDACHAAGSADLKSATGALSWKAGLPEFYYDGLAQGSGRVIIASSKESEYSYIRPQGDLSLFTWHLRGALKGEAAVRGDGLIHVLDVFHYVNEAVHTDNSRQTPILKVKDLDLNFPIALDRGGKGAGLTVDTTPITSIHEHLVRDPIAGAKVLSDYLASHPEWTAKRSEVDLKRAELEEIQRDIELFGPSGDAKATKNRAIYFLLRTCLELGRPD